jgi:hypothetical protein
LTSTAEGKKPFGAEIVDVLRDGKAFVGHTETFNVQVRDTYLNLYNNQNAVNAL